MATDETTHLADHTLADLKAGASPRKRKTLDLLNTVLDKQAKSGVRDFSIATIGRLSAAAGGPTAQSIRNRGGKDYRRLIEAWAASQGTTPKKPLSPTNRQQIPRRDEDMLKRIADPALRAVVGNLIAERNRYKSQVRLLQEKNDAIMDRRSARHTSPGAVEVLPSLEGLLTDMEREALEEAISDNMLQQRGWSAQDNGRIKDEHGRPLYKPGYVTAIKKILEETGHG